MITLSERIEKDGIGARVRHLGYVERVARSCDFAPDSDIWSVTLFRRVEGERRHVTFPFHTGPGIRQATPDYQPTAHEVLGCVLLDVTGQLSANGYAAWCAEYGYEDDRRARRAYRAIELETAKVRAFLGDDFDAYAWDTENDN